MSSDVISRPTITRWVLVLGISWFLAGFVGPMIVATGANQGPMVGIFISGPAGVVSGLVFAWLARMLDLSAQKAGRALTALAFVGSVVIIVVCIPSPRLSARLIEGSIVSCNPPSTLRTRTAVSMQDFSDRHFAALRKSNPWTLLAWENRFDELAAKEGGVILDIQTARVAGLYRGGARWDEGRETVSEWKPGDRRDTVYAKFAGNDCAAYRGAGSQVRLKLHGLINIWEPRSLPELMNLYTAEPFAGG